MADSLKPHMDRDLAFAIAFLPTVALIFGVYSLWSAERDRWDKIMVSFGGFGALALIAINIFAISELAMAPERADAGLIKLGIAVGTVFVAYYGYASHKFFRQAPIAA